MQIKHKTTLRLHKLWLKGDKGGVRANLSGANLSRADLSGTDLSRAYLSGTDLSRAYLMDAYLMDAYLMDANLRDVNLSRANLMDANLEGANLENANLDGADLRGADLRGAILEDADLSGTNLGGANLENANLENANLENANLDYQIQDGLLQQIAKIILENPKSLEMGSWHTCETTHCLAGWACYLNPVAKELEETHGVEIAGLLTLGYEAHAYFFKENEETIEWLKTIKD